MLLPRRATDSFAPPDLRRPTEHVRQTPASYAIEEMQMSASPEVRGHRHDPGERRRRCDGLVCLEIALNHSAD